MGGVTVSPFFCSMYDANLLGLDSWLLDAVEVLLVWYWYVMMVMNETCLTCNTPLSHFPPLSLCVSVSLSVPFSAWSKEMRD